MTEASFKPASFTTAQHPISPFTPRCPSLPFQERVHHCLAFRETPLPPEDDPKAEEVSDDEEDLQTANLDDPVWDKESVLDSR